jgi:hypothetical protein
MGMFRSLKGGAVVFYEFLTLVEDGGSLVLKLKHFNPDLTGWEEKGESITFHLVKITPTEAFFDGLTFRRIGDRAQQIFLAIRNRKDGSIREESSGTSACETECLVFGLWSFVFGLFVVCLRSFVGADLQVGP